jgi:hypothetical protein
VFERPGRRRASCFSGPVTKLRTAGLLLIAGSAITLALHYLEVPEDVYRWLYHHLLSGLDVPKEPSDGTLTAVRDVSLFGGILELVVGLGLLAADRLRVR